MFSYCNFHDTHSREKEFVGKIKATFSFLPWSATMIKFTLDIHFFTFSYTIEVFPRYLAKFRSVTNIRTRGFWTFVTENLRLGWEFESHFLKNATRVEIIITINVENCANTWTKVFFLLYANYYTNCYYNFKPCGILEKMTYFFQIRAKTLNKDYGGRKFSEINIQTNMSFYVRNRLKFAKISRKDLLCTKMLKKMNIEPNLIIVINTQSVNSVLYYRFVSQYESMLC